GYLQHYDWSLLNNFTFFLDDPVNGDQRRQYEKRWTYGGRVERNSQLNDSFSVRVGSEARGDDIGPVGLDNTVGGVFLSTVGAFDVLERSLGVSAEAIVRPTARLMVIGGLRGDWYRFRTEALAGATSSS